MDLGEVINNMVGIGLAVGTLWCVRNIYYKNLSDQYKWGVQEGLEVATRLGRVVDRYYLKPECLESLKSIQSELERLGDKSVELEGAFFFSSELQMFLGRYRDKVDDKLCKLSSITPDDSPK